MPGISISLDQARSARALRRLTSLLSPEPVFKLHNDSAPDRVQVEHYISDHFLEVHQAQIHDFMPSLLTMNCQGHISAAMGLRPAAGQPLFLERYLSQPVEQAIETATSHFAPRGRITEIGNLVATRRGSSQLLFLLTTAILAQTRFDWVVFTATPVVRKSLEALGIELHVLGQADTSSLSESELKDWGSYYDQRPMVVAGHVGSGMERLSKVRLFSGMLSLYSETITELSRGIDQAEPSVGTHAFAA